MASPAQIAASQANGRKSRGPTSARGRAVSSMNALKHARRSKKVRQMREDSYSFEERLRKWMASGDAQSDVEEFLMYRNVCMSFELDRAEHQRIARCETLIENSDEDEFAEVEALGKRLFFDPVGPTSLYGNLPNYRETCTSWNGKALDENDPAVLVKRLERTEAGCCWLLDQLHELRSTLESLGFWQSHDRLKFIRLMGRQPVEANEDVGVAQVFLACHALHQDGDSAFDDLLSDMSLDQRERYREALKARWPKVYCARPIAEWRKLLVDLVDENIERMNALLEEHQQNADAVAERTYARLSFDPSPEGEALRNYILKCTNALHRGLGTYKKLQAKRHEWRSCPDAGDRAAERHRPEFRGCNVAVSHPSQFDVDEAVDLTASRADLMDGAFDTTGSSDPAAPLASVADAAAHGHNAATVCEVSGGMTNEPGAAATAIIAETQAAHDVASNSSPFSGLDNRAIQPEDGTNESQAEAPVATSEPGGAELQPPDSGDNPGAGRSPPALSGAKKHHLRGENEQKGVESIVAGESNAGSTSVSGVLASVLAQPP